ncbi:MAG: helix-turn-helix domain-containing protein [Leptospira sp.]|nr:helix-turn-helix domain-containing protein [Leptospira sp.]
MDFHSALLTFIGFTGGLSLLLTFSELLSREKSSQTFIQAALFFLVFIFQSHTYFVSCGGYKYIPHFYLLHLPFTAMFGSFLSRFFSMFWNEGSKVQKFKLFELIPPLLVILLLWPFLLSSSEEKLRMLENFPKNGVPIRAKFAITVAALPVFIAAFFVFNKLFSTLRWQTIKKSPQLRMVLFVLGVGAFASLVGLILLYFHDRHGLEIVSAIIGLLIIMIHLLRHRNPELLGEVKRIVVEEKKYQVSQLKSVDLDTLGAKLNHLMFEKKFYRNDEMSLSDLANELSVSQHQLSEYLNLHLGKNFFQFVNFFRIQEAKELCKNAPEKTILSIAFEVGFPSKSTFYDAFKRETGLSPTEYRKLNLPK